MRRLADRLDYSANFAYRYFSGRDDILLALVRDGFARLREAMAAAAASAGATGRGADAAGAAAEAVRGAARAYLDFALAEPDLYQVMYGLGGVRVPTADTLVEGRAVGEVLIALLASAGDPCAEQHVLRLWATAHGLLALLAVEQLRVESAQLHTLLAAAVDDVLERAIPTPTRHTSTNPPTEDQP